MTRTARWLIGVAALAMSAAYALPLWRVALIAPQYPEGLGLLIHVNEIGGFKPGDLQSINGLNHYIGMKAIEPDAIPELRLMPVILGVLVVTGIGVAILGRRRPFAIWAAVLGLVLCAGLVDYYKWGYEYGHDLSPTAIIKIPGMTYQPPLIGSKKLLNFTATSWPASGGWILIVAAATVAGVLVSTFRRPRTRTRAALALVVAAGCGTAGPRAFNLHIDACEQCRMTIVDPRFGGQVVTHTGRVHTFDAIECLVAWVRTAPPDTRRDVYVIDLQHPGTFVRADSAAFLRGVLINSPMGHGIVAFATAQAAEEQRAMLSGKHISWQQLLADTATGAAVH